MEWILAKLGIVATEWVVDWSVYTLIGLVVAYVLKKIPNKDIQDFVGSFMFGAGKAISSFFNTWKWTKKFYEKVIEPYIIDAIKNILINGLNQLVDGLKLDNK